MRTHSVLFLVIIVVSTGRIYEWLLEMTQSRTLLRCGLCTLTEGRL
jgi:hypothetical protein